MLILIEMLKMNNVLQMLLKQLLSHVIVEGWVSMASSMVDSPLPPQIFLYPHSYMSPNIILRKNCHTKSNANFA